ncbi:hypothetical protein JVT61DRAFT_13428 [Boletus reticuloceps]|uniref:Uncharacterized protein n=1 Tax=Boletus reticuloceps TaxID=495285 RepID=A0A8I2YDK8_9AGAM|nr:hypothetical protein JVT61DRAFT_13428 [Boletus reticuloceps]
MPAKKNKDQTSGTTGKGAGKSTAKTKTTKVGATLLLDERPSGEGSSQVEASVLEKQKLEGQARDRIFGYARVDLIKQKEEFRFGTWNDRPLQTVHVKRLVQSFLTKGTDRFSLTKAIPLIVKKTDIKATSYKKSYTPGATPLDALPMLELEDHAIGKKMLVAGGGQHRLHAVEEWTKILEKQHTELVKVRAHLGKQDSENVPTMDIEEENQKYKPKRVAIEETLSFGGQWMAILYDGDKIPRDVALHLSQNESEHVYRQTAEEGIMHMFRTMKANGKTYRDVEEIEGVRGNPRKWAELLAQDYVWEFMDRTESMGIHMFDGRQNMKMQRFHSTMMGPIGGILSYSVAQMEKCVCQCFNEVPIDEKEVDALIMLSRGNHKAKAEKARDRLREIYFDVTVASDAMKGANGAMFSIRECMDDAFLRHMGPTSEAYLLFGDHRSHRWRKAVSNYMDEVIEKLPNVIAVIGSMDAPIDEEERQAFASMQWCVAKVKVVHWFQSRCEPEVALCMMPFMSRSVYDHMVSRLEAISKGIQEFCRWWDPMIDMVPVIGKFWTPGSASAAMVRAILCHPDIRPHSRTSAVHRVRPRHHFHTRLCTLVPQIIFIVWNDYASFVQMQLQLQGLCVPKRIMKQNKLLSIFGTTTDGGDTTDLREAEKAIRGTLGEKKDTDASAPTKGKGKAKAEPKGKGKAKGKSKKGKRLTAEDDDEDEDDDDEVESTNDNDDEDKQQRAHIRHENATKKHGAILAKNAEWSETHSILLGSKGDGRLKNSPTLDFTQSPPNFLRSWTKVSRLPRDTSSVPMRGLALVDGTTWEWKNIHRQSFSRVMRTFAAAAIAEASTIISYRHQLILCQPKGGAVTLRIRVHYVVTDLLEDRDAAQTSKQRQTNLKDFLDSPSQGTEGGDRSDVLTEGRLPHKGSITWADGIYPKVPKYARIPTHGVAEELAHLKRDEVLGEQQRGAQTAFNSLQRLRITWHDPTSRAQARDNPRLDDAVVSALRNLAEAMNVNAYRQRAKATRTVAFNEKEAMAPQERLRIVIRSDVLTESELDGEFFMGTSDKLDQEDVPTKDESIYHLQDLARQYCKWVAAREERADSGGSTKFTYKKSEHSEAEEGTDDDDDDSDSESDDDGDESEDENDQPEEGDESEDEIDQPEEGARDVDNASEAISQHDSVTVDQPDIAFWDDEAANSQGEFISDAPPAETPTVLVPSTPEHVRHIPGVLDNVKEVEEAEDGSSELGDISEAIRCYTTLADDVSTASAPIVSSPRAQPSKKKSHKRDRAPTVSSTGSKDEHATDKSARPSSEYTALTVSHIYIAIERATKRQKAANVAAATTRDAGSPLPVEHPNVVASSSKHAALNETSYQA